MAALQITDLDDFLTPSQACIIPVRQTNKPAGQDKGDNTNTEIVIDANNNYYEVSTHSTALAGPSAGVEAGRQALKKAEISLNDCLACSGCITSTESMLITMQSHNEVLDFIKAGDFKKTPVLSIAPQTLASLSASYADGRIPLLTLLRRIRAFLGAPERGAWQVWDTTFARHVALRELVAEFYERRAAAADGAKLALPMLASACPGWVCYAEKAQGDLLPLLSAARSPQGVMGALVKQWHANAIGRTPNDVYHVTAMPCYDKKLEASREDFYSEAFKTRETDCVLTTGELDLLLHELGFDPLAPVSGEDDAPGASGSAAGTGAQAMPELLDHPGSSSGSYLGTLLGALAAAHGAPTRIHERAVRGSTDNVEVFLEDAADGTVLFKGARCYGFRNLQNLVRKVGRETGLGRARPAGAGKLQAAVAARRRKARTGAGEIATPATPASPATPNGTDSAPASTDVAAAATAAARDAKKLDFVEVMACPGGCVNGGGQMKPAKDAEGYARPMPDDGVASAPTHAPDAPDAPVEPPRAAGLAGEEGLRWSTKEWVANVERVYWAGLPTPPASPKLGATKAVGVADPTDWPARTRAADELAESAVADMVAANDGDRFKCVRTHFRRVEGDVLSQGGLTHEQVKW